MAMNDWNGDKNNDIMDDLFEHFIYEEIFEDKKSDNHTSNHTSNRTSNRTSNYTPNHASNHTSNRNTGSDNFSSLGAVLCILSGIIIQVLLYNALGISVDDVSGFVILILWIIFSFLTALIILCIKNH